MTWTFTDDPNDPCPYCVSWVDPLNPNDDPDGEHSWDPDDLIPYAPDGKGDLVSINRVYRDPHDECQAAVDAYVSERDAENARTGQP